MSDKTYPLTLKELHQMIDPNWGHQNKIGIIKMVRALTGEGLREAKDFAEQVWWPMLEQRAETMFTQIGNKVHKPSYVEEESILQRLEALERQMAEIRSTRVSHAAKHLFNHQDGD